MIEIPPITPVVIEHRLHRLVCSCCSTSTCASLPADVEPSRYGPRLSALVGLLGSAFEGIVVSDRFSAYNHLPVEQRQLCWAHLIRDLSAIAERQGVSGETGRELLVLQQQLFVQWHQWKDGTVSRHRKLDQRRHQK